MRCHEYRRRVSRLSPRAIALRLLRAVKSESYAYWRRRPLRSNVVLYESFAGNGMLCNPEAIFRQLLDSEDFAGFEHVWALRSRSENRDTLREFRHHPRVRFVRHSSARYFRALATSGYLVNNATFPPEFGKREGQVYLNTWHGTPLKRMGYDIGDPASRVGNVIRNFLNADYLLSANRFMTERLYESAHLLTNIYRGAIIEEGYPRIDRQRMTDTERAAALARLGELGIRGRKVILYAPTWKGTNFNRPEDDAAELLERVAQLNAGVDSEKYVVVLKTHQVVHKFAAHLPEFRSVLVPNEIPTNVILGVTDILITDYSSIFFDFLETSRPIVFLTPDVDDYAGYRGLYIESSNWPGPVLRTVEETVAELRRLDESGVTPEVTSRQAAARETYCGHEDGSATSRVIDIVFRKQTEGFTVAPPRTDGRTTLLFYAGGMRPNGITSSLLSLLDSIDHDRFDVSVVFPNSYVRAVVANQRALNPRVRQFSRVGWMSGSKLAHLFRRVANLRGKLDAHATDPVQAKLWDDEWRRCFGQAHFDYVIDFSGYSAFWATLLLHAPDATRSIWMHNDLDADAHRVTRGRKAHLRDLRAVFSLYREYDHLVSVSPSLREINAASLAEYAPADRFVSARNLINAARVRQGVKADLIESATDVETGEVAPWAIQLSKRDPEFHTFVSVGRLSSEKNHARLIRAFAQVHADHPKTRLVIVGSGPRGEALERLIQERGLAGAVLLTGMRPNPYVVMAASDCFVLSSNYEGQPMVILEALVIGLPVVTVAFGSARDALPAGFGLVTERTDAALAEGMRAFLRGEVPSPVFDVARYTREALAEFYAAVGLSELEAGPATGRVVSQR